MKKGIMRPKSGLALLFLLSCLALRTSMAYTEEIPSKDNALVMEEEQRDASYYFYEHLLEASAITFPEPELKQEGDWREDKFVFKSLGAEGDIEVVPEIIKARTSKVI